MTRKATYDDRLQQLRDYRDTFGHVRVPQTYRAPDGFRLGDWVAHQRCRRRRGTLHADRYAALDALGMAWGTARTPHKTFEHHLQELREFIDEHGHAYVPASYRCTDGCALGVWITDQRNQYRSGTITATRARALDAIGMVWEPNDARWAQAVDRLRAYVSEHGHAHVHNGYVAPDGFTLNHWVAGQRVARRQGKLSDQRIADLNSLGMVWNPDRSDEYQQRWEIGLAHLHEFVDLHGHARVPATHVTADGYPLGTWVKVQRRNRKAGKLMTARVARLDGLGMLWDGSAVPWASRLAQWCSYVAATGTLHVPLTGQTDDGFAVGYWAGNQRQLHRDGRLPDDRIAALDAVNFPWGG